MRIRRCFQALRAARFGELHVYREGVGATRVTPTPTVIFLMSPLPWNGESELPPQSAIAPSPVMTSSPVSALKDHVTLSPSAPHEPLVVASLSSPASASSPSPCVIRLIAVPPATRGLSLAACDVAPKALPAIGESAAPPAFREQAASPAASSSPPVPCPSSARALPPRAWQQRNCCK